MGNGLCGKAPQEKEIVERPTIKIQVVRNPKVEKNNLFGKSKDNSLIIRNGKSHEDEKLQKLSFRSFEEKDLSFLDKKKGDKNETFSFVLYGEDVSKVRRTFLAELKNMKDLTLKISQNHLLLITEDNLDLINLLKKRNISPNNLFGNDNTIHNTILENTTSKIINNKNIKENINLEDYLTKKYNRMIQKSILGIDQDSSKFLNTFILEEEEMQIQIDGFLEKQNILNQNEFKINLWNDKIHEIEENLNSDLNKKSPVENKLKKLALSSNLNFDHNYVNFNKKNIFESFSYKIENLKKSYFGSELVYAALLGLIQYDELFGTRLLTRIIYPQKNGFPIPTDSGLHIVKLNINGGKRAVPLQDIDKNEFPLANERFSFIIEKALSSLYLESFTKKKHSKFQNINISNLVFRLSNWIPETLNVFDIGDSLASFSKLEENFNKGFLILFYKDSLLNKIKPILNLVIDKNNYKRFIKTTSESNDDKFVLMDWEDLYNKNKIENLYINWNPTIYNFRKKIHFEVNVKFEMQKNSFLGEGFKFCRYSQVLLTVFPHSEQSESRLIIEKHRNINNMNFRIKYYLFHFFNNRMISKEPALKEAEVNESENELLTDIIVFDKNSSYENYILMFELIPEKKEDFKKLDINSKEVLSLSIFSFAEFQIIEIPFKKIDGYQLINTNFCKTLKTKEKQNNTTLSLLNPISNYFPLFKLACKTEAHYEVRVEGLSELYYGIYIYNFKNYKKDVQNKKYLKSSPFKNKETCTISSNLEKGDYILQIVPSKQEGQEDDETLNIIKEELIKDHEIRIELISYSKDLVQEFDKHLLDQKEQEGKETKKFEFSEINFENKLTVKNELEINWTSKNNFGTSKAKADCFQKFMKNPGFLIFFKEETEIKISLKMTNYQKEKEVPIFSINILKISKNFKFKNILQDDYKKGTEYETDEITLSPSEFGYLIICLNIDKDFIGKADFTIFSSKPLDSIRNSELGILNFENALSVSTQKFKKGSGGHFNNSSFLFNPVFKLRIPQISDSKNDRAQILIEMNIKSKEQPCSLYIYNSSKDSLFDLNNKELENGFYNPAFLYEFNSIFKKLLPGEYLLIPSTLNQLKEDLEFSLDISSDHKIDLISCPAFDFKQNSSVKISNCKEYKIKFKLLKKCKMLFTIFPKQDNIKIQTSLFVLKNNDVVMEKNSDLRDNFLHAFFDLVSENEIYLFNVKSDTDTSYDLAIFSTVSDSFKFF